jgi:hypothetical protein
MPTLVPVIQLVLRQMAVEVRKHFGLYEKPATIAAAKDILNFRTVTLW